MGRQHRPINQRIAETQNQLAQLLAKQAKAEVAQDPQIQALDERIKDLNATIVKLNRWETDAEEKYQNFIERAEAWQVKGAEATSQKPSVLKELATIKEQRKQLAGELALQMGDLELIGDDME